MHTDIVDKLIYEYFESMCATATQYELQFFAERYNIDLNYDDGLFLEIIGARNDIELIRMCINMKANIHINGEGVLRMTAHRGNIDMLKYLIEECDCDYRKLYKSTAYCNQQATKDYVDTYAAFLNYVKKD